MNVTCLKLVHKSIKICSQFGNYLTFLHEHVWYHNLNETSSKWNEQWRYGEGEVYVQPFPDKMHQKTQDLVDEVRLK